MCIWVARRFSVSRMSTIPVRLRQNSTQRSNIDMLGWGVPISILSQISQMERFLYSFPLFQTIAIDGNKPPSPVDISESHHIPTTAFIGFHELTTGWWWKIAGFPLPAVLGSDREGHPSFAHRHGLRESLRGGRQRAAGGKCCVVCVFFLNEMV